MCQKDFQSDPTAVVETFPHVSSREGKPENPPHFRALQLQGKAVKCLIPVLHNFMAAIKRAQAEKNEIFNSSERHIDITTYLFAEAFSGISAGMEAF